MENHKKRDLSGDNFDDYDTINSQKKIKRVVENELENYKSPNLFPNNSDVMSTLIVKNMELNEKIAEYRINNSFLETKINNIEGDNHLKNTYASSKQEELNELQNKIKDNTKENKLIKINLDKSQSIIFWQRILIVFELMVISLVLINNDINIFLKILN
jgi:hypothetical protein